jgi:uncharacterized protein (DUF433 family)
VNDGHTDLARSPTRETNRPLIGVGLYSVPEAQMLTRVPASSIRRWLFGYHYRTGDNIHEVTPVWRGQIDPVDDVFGLGFLDLIEVRFVHAFREHGVSWMTIREAAKRAKELFASDHPFATRRFKTDGKRIFAELGEATGDQKLIDLTRSQYAFHSVVAPSLYEGLEFAGDHEVVRWYPMWPRRQVVIDPQRAFGRPIVTEQCIPTDVLAKAVEAEGSIERVAKWYGTSRREIRAAIEFQRQLAA